MADAVSAELQVDRVAVFACHVADGAGDVAQTIARLSGFDAGRQSLFGALDQAQVVGMLRADAEADGGIRDPSVDVDRQIEADQIAVLQVVVVRNAVQHGVVHGRADVVRERTGAEIRRIVDVAGRGALAVHDALVDEFVDFQQIGADLGEFLQVAQDAADEAACGLHRFNLFRGFQFDHAFNPTSRAIHRRTMFSFLYSALRSTRIFDSNTRCCHQRWIV